MGNDFMRLFDVTCRSENCCECCCGTRVGGENLGSSPNRMNSEGLVSDPSLICGKTFVSSIDRNHQLETTQLRNGFSISDSPCSFGVDNYMSTFNVFKHGQRTILTIGVGNNEDLATRMMVFDLERCGKLFELTIGKCHNMKYLSESESLVGIEFRQITNMNEYRTKTVKSGGYPFVLKLFKNRSTSLPSEFLKTDVLPAHSNSLDDLLCSTHHNSLSVLNDKRIAFLFEERDVAITKDVYEQDPYFERAKESGKFTYVTLGNEESLTLNKWNKSPFQKVRIFNLQTKQYEQFEALDDLGSLRKVSLYSHPRKRKDILIICSDFRQVLICDTENKVILSRFEPNMPSKSASDLYATGFNSRIIFDIQSFHYGAIYDGSGFSFFQIPENGLRLGDENQKNYVTQLTSLIPSKNFVFEKEGYGENSPTPFRADPLFIFGKNIIGKVIHRKEIPDYSIVETHVENGNFEGGLNWVFAGGEIITSKEEVEEEEEEGEAEEQNNNKDNNIEVFNGKYFLNYGNGGMIEIDRPGGPIYMMSIFDASSDDEFFYVPMFRRAYNMSKYLKNIDIQEDDRDQFYKNDDEDEDYGRKSSSVLGIVIKRFRNILADGVPENDEEQEQEQDLKEEEEEEEEVEEGGESSETFFPL